MEKRIELERRGRPVGEIAELNLDNCRATQIVALTEEFTNLEVLSLINVGLTTLKGFPSLPKLKRLELSDNRITGGLSVLQGCPKLSSINLSGNKIKDIETLEPLKDLKELLVLDLFNCEVTNFDDYRSKVFQLLPSLLYLDGFDKQNEEAEDEDGDEDESSEIGEGEENEENEEDDDEEDDDEEEDGIVRHPDDADVSDEEDDDDEDDDDDEEDEDEEAAADPQRGVKRKHDEEEEEEEDS